jgi:adenylate kinase
VQNESSAPLRQSESSSPELQEPSSEVIWRTSQPGLWIASTEDGRPFGIATEIWRTGFQVTSYIGTDLGLHQTLEAAKESLELAHNRAPLSRLLMIGPPGSGKGTLAVKIANQHRVPAISTGDIFRGSIASRTELGLKVGEFLDSGRYVPDGLTNDLVRDRLSLPDVAHGFLLNGYPRTPEQVQELDDILGVRGLTLDKVIVLSVPKDELVRRLLKRLEANGRSDRPSDVIGELLRTYEEQTVPLISHYQTRGLVATVDGSGAVESVTGRIATALEQ